MLPQWYIDYKNAIEFWTQSVCEHKFGSLPSGINLEFKEAIVYALQGGKRIRAILALETFLSLSHTSLDSLGIDDDIVKFCVAIEMLHAYSLAHDDLPCMDNDEYRRGELTVWKKYGENWGVLVGDALNSLAFEVLSEMKSPVALKIINKFAKSVGIFGMIGGQVEDLYFENNFAELTQEKLSSLHDKKTGALIEMSILGGMMLAQNDEFESSLSQFGKNIGLAFQIRDDILDVEGTFETTGKSVGGENKGYVYFLGLEKSKAYLHELTHSSLALIQGLGSDKLNFIVEYIEKRCR